MEIMTIGNGAVQSESTDCTSFLVRTSHGYTVIDCGPGTVARLLSLSIPLAEIDTIFISHQHGDHIAEFAYLMFMINRSLRAQDISKHLDLIALPVVHAILQHMLASQYPPPAISHLHIRRIEADPIRRIDIDTPFGQVSTVPVMHSVPTIGLRIQSGTQSVAYSADTELSQEFVSLAGGVSVLLHQALCPERLRAAAQQGKHSTALDAGTAAALAGVDMLLLFHPLPEAMPYRLEMLDEAASRFDGLLRLPAAGDLISL